MAISIQSAAITLLHIYGQEWESTQYSCAFHSPSYGHLASSSDTGHIHSSCASHSHTPPVPPHHCTFPSYSTLHAQKRQIPVEGGPQRNKTCTFVQNHQIGMLVPLSAMCFELRILSSLAQKKLFCS